MLLSCIRRERAIFAKVPADDVEAANTSGVLEVYRRATIREELRRVPLAVGEATLDSLVLVSSEPGMLDVCAVLQQRLEQRDLHAGRFRMHAGGDQPKAGALPAIRVRLCVRVSACIEQHPGDRHDVLRRLLSKILDAIRGHVVQQRRPVLAG